MNKTKILIIINTVALIACLTWLILQPQWEPFVTLCGLIGTLVGFIWKSKHDQDISPKQLNELRNYFSRNRITNSQIHITQVIGSESPKEEKKPTREAPSS